jgi:hypothetical protein
MKMICRSYDPDLCDETFCPHMEVHEYMFSCDVEMNCLTSERSELCVEYHRVDTCLSEIERILDL